jgi:hypothetical protein
MKLKSVTSVCFASFPLFFSCSSLVGDFKFFLSVTQTPLNYKLIQNIKFKT